MIGCLGIYRNPENLREYDKCEILHTGDCTQLIGVKIDNNRRIINKRMIYAYDKDLLESYSKAFAEYEAAVNLAESKLREASDEIVQKIKPFNWEEAGRSDTVQ